MAEIHLSGINKVYPDGTHAVHDVDLHVADGEFLIMVGPSGCAKSTILRMIAGLEHPTGGTMQIGGRLVNDVPAKDRDIAMVFQSYALYPHMTVAENMAFGLRLRKMPETEIQQRIVEAARILGIEHLLQRKPKQMSGGQRQRVAMGRAIVREPQAFLMDEPLSNLDAKLRVTMRTQIAKLHARLGTTTVYVTHDQVEAMTLGQRICVLRKGIVQQVDTPYMVYTNPANVFVAGFIGSPGMNFMLGTLAQGADGSPQLLLGSQAVTLPASVMARLHPGAVEGSQVIVGIRPEHLYESTPQHAPNGLWAHVDLVETMGSEAYAYFGTDVPQPNLSEFQESASAGPESHIAKLHARTRARASDAMWLSLALEHAHIFHPQTMETLLAPLAPNESPAIEVPDELYYEHVATREPTPAPGGFPRSSAAFHADDTRSVFPRSRLAGDADPAVAEERARILAANPGFATRIVGVPAGAPPVGEQASAEMPAVPATPSMPIAPVTDEALTAVRSKLPPIDPQRFTTAPAATATDAERTPERQHRDAPPKRALFQQRPLFGKH